MPIVVIPVLPTPPDPTTDDAATFSSKASAFTQALPAFGVAMNTLGTTLGPLSDAGPSIIAAANYKGLWSGLTGALNIPASVYHLGRFWTLTQNSADVTTDVPGTSTKWNNNYGVEVAMASAATLNIGAQTSRFVTVSGTTDVNSLGTTYSGPVYMRILGTFKFIQVGTTLITPNGGNLPVRPGDVCIAYPKATAGVADGWVIAVVASKYPPYAFRNSGSGTITGTLQTLTGWAVSEYNYGGAFNDSTGVFTAPTDGMYTFTASIQLSSASSGTQQSAHYYYNGAVIKANSRGVSSTVTNVTLTLSDTINMVAGDTLVIRATGGGLSLNCESFSGRRL